MKNFKTIRELIFYAKKKIKPKAWKWLDGSAEYGNTTQKNRDIFRKVAFIPRVLKDTTRLDIKRNFFGKDISSPILISPVGGLNQFELKAEYIISDVAEKNKMPYFFPNNSSETLKQMNSNKKKQFLSSSLYLDNDAEFIKKSINEAEANNCHSISITLDSPVRPYSYNKMDQGYDARKHYKKKPLNYLRKKKGKPIIWKDIEKIRKMTKKPIILKGILAKEDALQAYNLGVDGIWVSNHGGRVLETDITSLEVLEEIKFCLKKKNIKIIADGGVRTGTDVLKTLCLGADFIGIGRPIAYGLIAGKFSGVDFVINNLINEFKSAMKLAGISNLDEIRSVVTKNNF